MESRVIRTAVVTLAACFFVGTFVSAQQPAGPPPIDVAQELQAAKASFKPIAADQVTKSRQSLRASLANLTRYLAGNRTHGPGWRTYLNLDAVAQQVNGAGNPDVKVLDQSLVQAESNTAGLERPQFIAFRKALRDYVQVVVLAGDEKASGNYTTHLDALAAALEGKGTAAEREQAVESTASWLIRAGQAPQVVSGLRQKYSYPNLQVRASGRLIKSGFDQEVDDRQRVYDNILGTSINANAHTTGTLTSALVPSENRATFELRLQGITRSQSVGHNGPVTIYSTAMTQVTAGKLIYFDREGFLSPGAWARCDTDSNVYALCARCALIERMAWKRVGKQQGQAEQVASRHAETRVVAGMETRAAQPIAEANQKYQEKFRAPLVRRDAFPRIFKTRTTNDAMYLTSLQQSASGLGAPEAGSPPPEGYDIAVRAHQSSVNNLAASMLAGYELTDLRLVSILRDDLKVEVPAELQAKEDDEEAPVPGEVKQANWTITFAHVRPFAVDFAPGQVTIAIRGDRFTRGNSVVRKSMEIGAVYKIEQSADGPTLVRQGEVDARYVNLAPGQKESTSEVTMKTVMRRKFAAMFKPTFPEPKMVDGKPVPRKGIDLPGKLAKGGQLFLKLLETSDGWIGAGLNQVPPAPTTPVPTATAQTE